MPTKYPQHEKLAKVEKERQAIGEFIEFLAEQDLFDESTAEATIAEFFDVDLKAFEAEKRAMVSDTD